MNNAVAPSSLLDAMMLDIPHIDDDHREIADAFAILEDALGHAGDCLAELAHLLFRRIACHFGEEETMLRAYRYPKLEHHVAGHRAFLVELDQLRRQLAQGVSVNRQRVVLLKARFYENLLLDDRDYMWFFRDRGIQPRPVRPPFF